MVNNSKKYTLRFNKNNPDSKYSFYAIRDGKKKVETRAATDKYKRINVGDKLIFTCGKEKIEKGIKKVKIFKNINQLLRSYKVKDIMPNRSKKEELEKAYYGYQGYKEKIKKYGLIALELD